MALNDCEGKVEDLKIISTMIHLNDRKPLNCYLSTWKWLSSPFLHSPKYVTALDVTLEEPEITLKS